MPAAARVGDPTEHGGVLLPPGVINVWIEGKPAAVVGTVNGCVPHAEMDAGNLVLPGIPRGVEVGGRPIACAGDSTTCDAKISFGALTVMIGGEL